MKADLNQIEIFTTTTSTAPTGADTPLSALEAEGWYVLPILTRQWSQATTRKDWKRLQEWLDVLSINAALYKSRDILDEYNLLGWLAHHHRFTAARREAQS